MKFNPSLIPRFNIDYSFKDLLSGLNAVLFRKEADHEDIKHQFNVPDIFFTNYSRSGICLILKSLGLPAGSKVGVPLYSCTVVFDAIINAGMVPKFIDIDENYTLDTDDLRDKVGDIKALIVIHTFGRLADMDEIKNIAAGIPIIEDCAHSIFSKYKGKQAGTLGDFSIFSLPKYLSAGGGGMILVNNKSYLDSFSKEMLSLESPTFMDEIVHMMVMYARSFFYHKPWFGLLALPIGLSVESKVDLMDKTSFTMKQINRSDLAVTVKKMKTFQAKVEIQRMRSRSLLDELANTAYILPFEKEDTVCNYYLFPVQVREKAMRDKLCDHLRDNDVDTTKLFSQTPYIAKVKYGYDGDCPNTEVVADRILTVPNHYTLCEKDLKKVVAGLRSFPDAQ